MRQKSNTDRGTFLGCNAGRKGNLVLFGVPFDHGSVQSGGCADAPSILRDLTSGDSIDDGMWDYSNRRKILRNLKLSDAGNFDYRASISRKSYFQSIEDFATRLAKEGRVSIALGGDHSITLPLARGVAKGCGEIQIIHLDAHHDYAPVHRQSLPTHSNFVSFLASCKNVHQIIQVGVRGYSSWLPKRPNGVSDVSLKDLRRVILPDFDTYLTIDTDAFDPSIAPAVLHPLPNGLKWSDLDLILTLLVEMRCKIVGVDWTEYNPTLEQRNLVTGVAIVHALIRILEAISQPRNNAVVPSNRRGR